MCRASDHQPIGLCVVEHEAGLVCGGDVAVRDHRNADTRFDFRNRVVLGLTLIRTFARAAMQGQRLNTQIFRHARDAHRIAMVAIPTRAGFQSDWHGDGLNDRFQNLRDQRLIFKQGGASQAITHALGRTTHVDVDNFRAVGHMRTRGFGQHCRLRAGDLHDVWRPIGGEIETALSLRGLPKSRIGGGHFRRRVVGAEFATERAHNAVGYAGHRREY